MNKYDTPVDKDTEIGSLVIARSTRYTSRYPWNTPGFPYEGRVYKFIDLDEVRDDKGIVEESYVLVEYNGNQEWFGTCMVFIYDAPPNAEYKSGGNI